MTAKRARGSPATDVGSASVWVLTCSLLLLTVGLTIALQTSALLARHRAQTAADLAALAGAGQIGVTGAICDAARHVAAVNATELLRCSARLDPGGRSGEVEVQVRLRVRIGPLGELTSTATARAGRDPP